MTSQTPSSGDGPRSRRGVREASVAELGRVARTSPERILDRPVLWTTIVAALLLVPLPPELFPAAEELAGGVPPDFFVHVALFAALGRSWLGGERWERTSVALAGVAGATAYGGLLELVQPAVGRSAEWSDLAADLVGTLVGWAWARLAGRRSAF